MSFLDDFEKLRRQVPHLALMNFQAQNAEHGNFTCQCKNSYSNVGSDFLSECLYNYWGYRNQDCVDCSYSRSCTKCYECLDCRRCSGSDFLQDCEDCDDCTACYDCVGLKDCFACIGLWRKQYHIYNRPYSKEEYFQKIAKLKKKSPRELRGLFKEVKTLRPHVYMHQSHNQGACTGDYVSFSRDSYFCFDVEHAEESLYMNNAINCDSCVDISYAGEEPLKNCYEIMSGIKLENSNFCSQCWYGKNLEYCELCFDCEYCVGCVGLKGRRFYILNAAYSPESYFQKIQELKRQAQKEGWYGKWFSSQYPIEDTKMNDEFSMIEHVVERPLRSRHMPYARENMELKPYV